MNFLHFQNFRRVPAREATQTNSPQYFNDETLTFCFPKKSKKGSACPNLPINEQLTTDN
jgi:hypothetical protein